MSRIKMHHARPGHLLVLNARAEVLGEITDPMPTVTDLDDPTAIARDELLAARAWKQINLAYPTATMLAMSIMTMSKEVVQ